MIATAEGNGPVNALDLALRDALDGRYPALDRIHLTDYKVRVLDTEQGHRRDHPGAARHHRRRESLDHHRRQREHHRGQLAGPVGLDRLRLAPSLDPGVATCRCPPTRTFPSRSTRSRASELNLAPGSPHAAGAARGGRTGPATSARSSRRARCSARPARTSASRSRSPTGRATGCASSRTSTSDDAIAVVAELAMKRAATFGRAPTILDVDFAIELLGYAGDGAGGRPRAGGRTSCAAPPTTTWCAARSSTP